MDQIVPILVTLAGLAFAMTYGARFLGAVATAWRPIRGNEARPAYWQFGWAVLLLAAGLGLAFAGGGGLAFAVLGLAALGAGAVLMARWWLYTARLEDDALAVSRGPLGEVRIARAAIQSVALETHRSALAFQVADGAPVRLSLSMDGLDSIAAALARAGAAGLDWEAFMAARREARGR